MIIQTELAGLPARLLLRCPEAARYFSPYVELGGDAGYDACVTERDRRLFAQPVAHGSEPYQEYSLLVAGASRFLLRHDRVVYHGVALRVRGRGFIITAPSGTGKTTQYNWLARLYGPEVELICGDKPILQRTETGMLAHPSPWPGKEGLPCGAAGPICGVVVLEQAGHNTVTRLDKRKAVFPVFREILYASDDEETAALAGRMAEGLLGLPVWKLENLGDEASARLLYKTLTEYDENI